MRRVAAYLGLIALLVLVVFVAERTRRSVDLTAGSSLTLTDETKDVVEQIDDDVRVTAVLTPGQPGRAESVALLGRFRRQNRNIRVRVISPESSPGEVGRLGVDPLFGGLAIESGGKIERASTVSEQDVTAGLARILRGVDAKVCVTTGHGEPSISEELDEGLSLAARLLRDNGYRLEEVDLLTTTALPDDCRALLIVNPLSPFGDAEAVIAAFLDDGGRAMVLTDPSSTVDLSSLVEPYGMRIARGIVLEGDENSHLPGDSITPVVSRYRSSSPVARRLPPTVYAGAQGITIDQGEKPGLAVTHVARTSELSYLERKPAEPSFDDGEDIAGPIVVVAAADRSANEGGSVTRTRVLVSGDAELATNGFIRQGGNGRLVIQGMDWLTLDEDLVSISANLPSLRPLSLTATRSRYMRVLMGGIVPALFLLSGAFVWAIRRVR